MNEATQQALLDSLKELSKSILRLLPTNTDQIVELINNVSDLSYLTSLCAGHIEMSLEQKQKVLEMNNLKERCLYLLNMLQELKEGLQVQNEIRGRLNQKMGQAQRQTILREQLKAIREELGEGDISSKEDELRKKISEAGMPEDVKKVAENELQRLTEVGNQSPESHIIVS